MRLTLRQARLSVAAACAATMLCVTPALAQVGGEGGEPTKWMTAIRGGLGLNSTEGIVGLMWQSPAMNPDKFLRFRHLEASEHDRRAGGGVSATIHFRDRNEDVSFHGQRCRKCGQEQFPFQRVCFTCYRRDDFDEVRLSDRTGKVLSHTLDFFAGSPDPPLVVTMVEAEGGARLYLQMTDASPKEAKLDLPVEFTFRKVHEFGGTPNYFWKCTPVR